MTHWVHVFRVINNSSSSKRSRQPSGYTVGLVLPGASLCELTGLNQTAVDFSRLHDRRFCTLQWMAFPNLALPMPGSHCPQDDGDKMGQERRSWLRSPCALSSCALAGENLCDLSLFRVSLTEFSIIIGPCLQQLRRRRVSVMMSCFRDSSYMCCVSWNLLQGRGFFPRIYQHGPWLCVSRVKAL